MLIAMSCHTRLGYKARRKNIFLASSRQRATRKEDAMDGSDWTRSPPLTNPSTPPVRWDVPSPSLARALHQVISRNRVSAAEPTKRRHCSLPIVVAFGKPPVHAGPPDGGRWRSWNTLSASPTPVQERSRHCGQGTWWSSLQVYESARCSRTNASTSSLLPLTANLPSGRTDARSRMSAYVGAETTT